MPGAESPYARVRLGFWTDPDVKRVLEPDAKLLALYYFSSPHSNMIGLYYCPHTIAADETGLSVDRVADLTVNALHSFVSFDPRTDEVLVHRSARHKIGETLKAADNRIKPVRALLLAAHSKWLVQRFMDLYPDWPVNLPRPQVTPPQRELAPSLDIEVPHPFPALPLDILGPEESISQRNGEGPYEAPSEAPYEGGPQAPSDVDNFVENSANCEKSSRFEGAPEGGLEGGPEANAVQCSAVHSNEEKNTLASLAAAPNFDQKPLEPSKSSTAPTGDEINHTDAYLMGMVRKHLYQPDGKPPEGWNEAREITCFSLLRARGYTGEQIARVIEGVGAIIRDKGRVGNEVLEFLAPSSDGSLSKATMRAIIGNKKNAIELTPLWTYAEAKLIEIHKQDKPSTIGGPMRLKIISGGKDD